MEASRRFYEAVPVSSYAVIVWRGEYYSCYAAWVRRYSFDDVKWDVLMSLSTCLFAALVSSILANGLTVCANRDRVSADALSEI